MAELLYLQDSYLKEFEAKVVAASGKHVFLDETAFYPDGGGVPGDRGTITRKQDGAAFSVVSVSKTQDGICHEVDREGLKADDVVCGKLDWERRYRLMRMHTTAHLLSALLYKRSGVLITGNQLGTDRSRMDFSLENFDRSMFAAICSEANELVSKGVPVKIYFLPRDEALKIEGVVKLAGALPPNIETLRIVEIVGVDMQADGGPHVANLKELGSIEIVKMENKGKANRRVYFTLRP